MWLSGGIDPWKLGQNAVETDANARIARYCRRGPPTAVTFRRSK
jgi:hypothetical protein